MTSRDNLSSPLRPVGLVIAAVSVTFATGCGDMLQEKADSDDTTATYDIRFYLPSETASLALLAEAATLEVTRYRTDPETDENAELSPTGVENMAITGSYVDVPTQPGEVIALEAESSDGQTVASAVVPALLERPTSVAPLAIFEADNPLAAQAFKKAPFPAIAVNMGNLLGDISKSDFNEASFRQMAIEANKKFASIDRETREQLIRVALSADENPPSVTDQSEQNPEALKMRYKIERQKKKTEHFAQMTVPAEQLKILKGDFSEASFVPEAFKNSQERHAIKQEFDKHLFEKFNAEDLTPEQLETLKAEQVKFETTFAQQTVFDFDAFKENLATSDFSANGSSSQEDFDNLFKAEP